MATKSIKFNLLNIDIYQHVGILDNITFNTITHEINNQIHVLFDKFNIVFNGDAGVDWVKETFPDMKCVTISDRNGHKTIEGYETDFFDIEIPVKEIIFVETEKLIHNLYIETNFPNDENIINPYISFSVGKTFNENRMKKIFGNIDITILNEDEFKERNIEHRDWFRYNPKIITE